MAKRIHDHELIKKLYQEGHKLGWIATTLGVPERTIRRICLDEWELLRYRRLTSSELVRLKKKHQDCIRRINATLTDRHNPPRPNGRPRLDAIA